MGSPDASRNGASVACRAAGSSPTRIAAISGVLGPETRTTPTPPRPGGVAAATMVSGWLMREAAAPHRGAPESTFPRARAARGKLLTARLVFRRDLPVDVPLLEDRQPGVRNPVEHEARREQRKHHREDDGHELEDLRLHRIRRWRIQFVLEPHRE